MFVLIYQVNYVTGRTTYWNTCGWTDSRRSARRYSPSEAEPVVRRMMIDSVHAKTTPPSPHTK